MNLKDSLYINTLKALPESLPNQLKYTKYAKNIYTITV